MFDFIMRVLPALFFFIFYMRFSTTAKQVNDNSYEGITVSIPKLFHHLLFPGAKFGKKPLFSVILTAISLIAIILMFFLSAWITFFMSVEEMEKVIIYKYSVAFIFSCYLIVLFIAWIIIVMHQKSVHIVLRAIIIILTVIVMAKVFYPVVGFFIRFIAGKGALLLS